MKDQMTCFYLSMNDFEVEMGISASCRLNKLILYDLFFTSAPERKFKKLTLHEESQEIDGFILALYHCQKLKLNQSLFN